MKRFAVITHRAAVIVIIYLFQWRSQDSQHVHKRKLNEKKFVFIFPANISEYGIVVIN